MASDIRHEVRASLHDDRGTWVVRGRVYDPETGETRQKSKSTGFKVKDNTKRKAEARMKEILAAWEREASESLPCHELSFRYYVNAWLNDKSHTARANTVKSYRDYTDKHILPALGEYDVRDISWRTLQRFYEELLKSHKVVTVRKFDIVVKGALDDAVRDGAIQSNPSSLVKWPKREPYEARPFSLEEAGKILAMAENAEEPMKAAIILGLCYGLRRSEVCGLRWMDIDFEAGLMYIRHTVTQNGQVLLDDDHTKTRKSKRALSLIPSTIPYLRSLRVEHIQNGLTLDKVAAWPDGHSLRPDGITRMFKTLLKRNKLDPSIRFHDLRHMTASMLANAGIPLKAVQDFLGHEDLAVTLGVYVQSEKESGKRTAVEMDKILNGLTDHKDPVLKICSELD